MFARCLWTLLLIWCGLFTGIMLTAGSTSFGVPPPCDKLCRMRTEHKYCGSGKCVKFMFLSCVNCSPILNHQCVDNNDYDVTKPNCLEPLTPAMNTATYYSSCDPHCDCDYFVVEAQMTGDEGVQMNFIQYVCRL